MSLHGPPEGLDLKLFLRPPPKGYVAVRVGFFVAVADGASSSGCLSQS
jgi:hypothetical protein